MAKIKDAFEIDQMLDDAQAELDNARISLESIDQRCLPKGHRVVVQDTLVNLRTDITDLRRLQQAFSEANLLDHELKELQDA